MVVIGALVTIKADWMYENFGAIPTFDKYLGTEGGTRLGYKLIGMVVSILGFLAMTNLLGGIIIAIFGSMFSGLAA